MKILDLYQKLTLANMIHWFAMRLLRVAKEFCGSLISFAIYLNPDRKIFSDNLAKLKLNDSLGYFSRKKTLPFYSIPEGCRLLSQQIEYFDVNQTIKLSLPKVVNDDFLVSEKYAGEAKLPDTYLARLDNALVFSGTDLIVIKDLALYDEIDRNNIYTYAIKPRIIAKVLGNEMSIKVKSGFHIIIEQAIHFAKDHSKNYFHWLVECLPRLSLISHLDKNIPLLVDADLYPQAFEALKLLNIDNRELIKLHKSKNYIVKTLFYPSQLSEVHDNYGEPNYHKDAIYSPKAINYVRDSVFKALNISDNKKKSRKLFVSRKTSDYRQLLNSTEIEDILVAKDFEIIFPENLSFFAQVKIFSEAEVIIGQSGAGMANIIFAPKNCKVLMLAGDAANTNLHGFSLLAQVLGVNFNFLFGKVVNSIGVNLLHADFYIDTKLLLDEVG